MKMTLRISLAANVCLAALVFWVGHHSRTGADGAPVVPVTAGIEATIPVTQPVAKEASAGQENHFKWSQLESPDYRTYISNLAAIGCPKQTIRDIITADVDNLYAARRAQIMGTPLGTQLNAKQALDLKVQGLYREEASVLTALLDARSGASQPVTDNTPAPVRTQRDQTRDNGVSVPLVFQAFDPAALKQLNDGQLADIDYLRYRFQEQIGGSNQDPNDPAYLKRWQAAQPQNDLMLHAMLGTQAYEALQNATGNKAAAPR